MPKRKPKQEVVESAVLKPIYMPEAQAPYCIGRSANNAVCVAALRSILRIEMPTAKRYWLQASLTQWDDKSGSPVWVEVRQAPWLNNLIAKVSVVKRGGDHLEDVFLCSTERLLLKLGVGTYTPTKVYVRLMYED